MTGAPAARRVQPQRDRKALEERGGGVQHDAEQQRVRAHGIERV